MQIPSILFNKVKDTIVNHRLVVGLIYIFNTLFFLLNFFFPLRSILISILNSIIYCNWRRMFLSLWYLSWRLRWAYVCQCHRLLSFASLIVCLLDIMVRSFTFFQTKPLYWMYRGFGWKMPHDSEGCCCNLQNRSYRQSEVLEEWPAAILQKERASVFGLSAFLNAHLSALSHSPISFPTESILTVWVQRLYENSILFHCILTW